jgi:hypothetical protein
MTLEHLLRLANFFRCCTCPTQFYKKCNEIALSLSLSLRQAAFQRAFLKNQGHTSTHLVCKLLFFHGTCTWCYLPFVILYHFYLTLPTVRRFVSDREAFVSAPISGYHVAISYSMTLTKASHVVQDYSPVNDRAQINARHLNHW